MTIAHHPEEALLFDHAAGALDEGAALAVAVHLAFCPECRDAVARMETLGGALLDDIAPVALGSQALDAVYARITRMESRDVAARQPQTPPEQSEPLPAPLRPYVGGGMRSLAWRRAGRVREARLALAGAGRWRASLVRMRGGAAVPAHTHAGTEYTIVLQGGYSDATGRYAPGDFACADPSLSHRPCADPGEECIVLAVQDAPVRLTGALARLLNPILASRFRSGRP